MIYTSPICSVVDVRTNTESCNASNIVTATMQKPTEHASLNKELFCRYVSKCKDILCREQKKLPENLAESPTNNVAKPNKQLTNLAWPQTLTHAH